MVKGFEKETEELSEEELRGAHLAARFIQDCCVGNQNSITSSEIIDYLRGHGLDYCGARIRKLIHHLRVSRIVPNLVANSKGYYVETDPKKIKEYIDSLTQRANSILAVRDSFRPAA